MVIIERSIPVHVYWQNCNEQSSARLSLTKKISDKNYIIVRRCWQNTQELGSDIVTLLNPPPPKKELTQTIFCIFISTHTHTHQKKRGKKRKYTEWVQHIIPQSCYFLVVLRISAILWNENKYQQLGPFYEFITRLFISSCHFFSTYNINRNIF